jgi:hypothetical protein
MLASPAIEGRIAATAWRPFGRRLISFVHGMGETLTIKVRVRNPEVIEIGATIVLIDSRVKAPVFPFRGKRLYLDFAKHGLTAQGSYGVWTGREELSSDQRYSGEFECLSTIVDDWFTFVPTEVDLTLLCITNGGSLRIDNHHLAMV